MAILPISIYGQSLKTFSGEFNDGKAQNGVAIYTYYEDPNTHEYVKQGSFKYTFDGQGSYKGYNQTITGNFEKGLRNGLWTYTISMSDFGYNNPYFTGKITLTANYKNGYADGNWKEIRTLKSRKKYLMYGQYNWEEFEPVKNMIIDLNFKSGYVIGELNINDEFSKFKMNLSLDNNSYLTGTSIVSETGWGNNYQDTFKDNYLYESINRGNNGEVKGQSNNQTEYDSFLKTKTMSINQIEDAGFVIDTICGMDKLNKYFSQLFSEEYFLFDKIDGDLTYKAGSFLGICYFKLKSIDFYPIANNSSYIEAEKQLKNNNLFIAYEKYHNSLLNNNSTKPSERKMVNDKMSIIKPQINEIITTYGSNKKYFDDYLANEFDSLNNDVQYFSKKIKLKNQIGEYVRKTEPFKYDGIEIDGKIIEVFYCKCSYNDERQVSSDAILVKPWLAKNWTEIKDCFAKNKGLYNITQIAITEQFINYSEFLNKEKRNLSQSRVVFYDGNKQFDFYIYDKGKFLKNLEEIKKRYEIAKSFIDKEMRIFQLKDEIESLNSIANKKILFSKYQIVLNDFLQKRYDYIDLQASSNTLNSTILFLEKVSVLYSQDTKEIEKRLKKEAVAPEQIIKLTLEF